MMKAFFRMVALVTFVMFASTASTTFAGFFGSGEPAPEAKIYDEAEMSALVEGPKLINWMGHLTHEGIKADTTIKQFQKKVAKNGGDGLFLLKNVSYKKNETDFTGSRPVKTFVSADYFKLEEPTAARIREVIHRDKEASIYFMQSAMAQAVRNRYTELSADILDEVLTSRYKVVEFKNVMLDAYVTLAGNNATNGLKQVANSTSRQVQEDVKAHAIKLIARGSGNAREAQ